MGKYFNGIVNKMIDMAPENVRNDVFNQAVNVNDDKGFIEICEQIESSKNEEKTK